MAAMFDDDFFELDEDLLNATGYFGQAEESSVQEIKESNVLRYFNCLGEDVLSKHAFHPDSFIECSEMRLIESENAEFSEIILFNLNLSNDSLTEPKMLQNLINKCRMNIQTMIAAARENSTFVAKKNFFELRKQVTSFLFQLRKLLYAGQVRHSAAEGILRPLTIYLDHLATLPIADIIHTTYSSRGNESNSPAHHLMHGHLEWRWLHLTIALKIEKEKRIRRQMGDGISLHGTEVEELLKNLVFDAIMMSASKFNRLATSELPDRTPFVCTCHKELWLMIQFLLEKLNNGNCQLNKFWFYFNNALKSYRERKPAQVNGIESVARDVHAVYPNDFLLFGIWLLSGVNELTGFAENGLFIGPSSGRLKENVEMLESLLRSFVVGECAEQNLRSCLLIVNPLLTDWWTGKSDLVMIFWEYFHKKLNSSFFIGGSAPNSLAVTSSTSQGYIEQITKLLELKHPNSSMASFSLFANLLGRILSTLVQNDSKSQIQKIMGRIFTKFSESKMVALNEIGIHNLLTLFLTLAIAGDLKSTSIQLQNILLMLRLEKLTPPRQLCAVKGHMAMISLFAQNRIDSHGYIIRFFEQINKLAVDENKSRALRIVADSCEHILDRPDIFECGEFILIEAWMTEHLNFCKKEEQEEWLQLINSVLLKLDNAELCQKYSAQCTKLTQCIYNLVLPHVRKIYRQSDALGISADIASTFCLYATGRDGIPSFDELFKYFTESMCCDPQITTRFLVAILSTDKINKIQEIALVRLWIRCSALTTVPNEDLKQLTKIVLKLAAFKVMCKSEEHDLLEAKEPLSVFFASCGQTYESSSGEDQNRMANHLQAAISGFEKWTPISESPPSIIKIHIVIGLIILHCSPIVYVHSKPSCFFNVVMNHYILPLQLMMGKPQKPISVQAVHKVWHLIVSGIEKLDYKTDLHLQRVLSDLVIKWVPQFRTMNMQKIISKPFIMIAQHSQASMVHLIFDKLASNFLSSQRRETHQNAPIVATIMKDVLTQFKADAIKVKCLLDATCSTMLEHVMMIDDEVPSKAIILELFAELFRSNVYISTASPEIKECMVSNLKTLTTKQLSYYSVSYFHLITKFAKINIGLVQEIMDHLLEQVENVERIRGVGPDAKLRTSLRQLQNALT